MKESWQLQHMQSQISNDTINMVPKIVQTQQHKRLHKEQLKGKCLSTWGPVSHACTQVIHLHGHLARTNRACIWASQHGCHGNEHHSLSRPTQKVYRPISVYGTTSIHTRTHTHHTDTHLHVYFVTDIGGPQGSVASAWLTVAMRPTKGSRPWQV